MFQAERKSLVGAGLPAMRPLGLALSLLTPSPASRLPRDRVSPQKYRAAEVSVGAGLPAMGPLGLTLSLLTPSPASRLPRDRVSPQKYRATEVSVGAGLPAMRPLGPSGAYPNAIASKPAPTGPRFTTKVSCCRGLCRSWLASDEALGSRRRLSERHRQQAGSHWTAFHHKNIVLPRSL